MGAFALRLAGVPPLAAALLLCCAQSGPPVPELPSGPDTLKQRAVAAFHFCNRPDVVARVRYIIDWGDFAGDTTAEMRLGDTAAVSHAWNDTGVFAVRCRVQNGDDRLSDWSPARTVVVTNDSPRLPDAPRGPDTLVADSAGEFRARTTDPEADLIRYVFDWGNGDSSTSAPHASGDTARVLYSWPNTGEYAVRVKARDEAGHESGWSAVRRITIIAGGQFRMTNH